MASLEAKKKHAKKNKLYADAKLYSEQLKVAKADLEKVNVTNGGERVVYIHSVEPCRCVCVCVCVCLVLFLSAIRRKSCSLSWTKLQRIPITKSVSDFKTRSKCSCR